MPREETGTETRREQAEPQNDARRPQDGAEQARQGSNQQPAEPQDRSGSSRTGLGEILASAAVRWGIGIAGFVLFLFAIGQAVGLNLLGMFAEALSSQTGQWLVVAVFALFLIAVARRGIARTFRT